MSRDLGIVDQQKSWKQCRHEAVQYTAYPIPFHSEDI